MANSKEFKVGIPPPGAKLNLKGTGIQPGEAFSFPVSRRIVQTATAITPLFLAACKPTGVEAAIPTINPATPDGLTPTPSPENPTPSVPTIEVDGLQLPDPKISNPEFFDITNPDSPIVEFANALGVKPEEVLEKITYEKISENFYVAIYETGADFKEKLGLDKFPLFKYTKDSEGNLVWSDKRVAADLFQMNGKIFGATAHYPSFGDELGRDMATFIRENFNGLILENHVTWRSMEKTERQENDVSRENQVKALIDYAEKYRMAMVGRSVIYYGEYPSWLKDGGYSRDQLEIIMNGRIDNFLTAFPKIQIVELFNELHPINLGWHPDVLQKGQDINQLALEGFREAIKLNPEGVYMISDGYNYTTDGVNYKRILDLVNYLKDNGIDPKNIAVGMHGHINGTETVDPNKIVEAIRGLGVKVFFTELDVNMKDVSTEDPDRLLKQAKIYGAITQACLEASNCQGVFIWNPGDNSSWLENPESKGEPYYSPNADGTPFGDDLKPKLSYYVLAAEALSALEQLH